MIRLIFAAALLCVSSFAYAEPSNNFLEGIRSIDVVMHRVTDKPHHTTRRARRAAGPEICTASQYGVGDGYHGKRTADGSIFNTYANDPYTVAHLARRLGSYVTVTNLSNGKSIRAKVTDRGPYYHGRCVDMGRAGADAIGMGDLARVRVE